MKEIISKKLLCEVMNSSIYLEEGVAQACLKSFNIHELAHMCKEWARKTASYSLNSNLKYCVGYPIDAPEELYDEYTISFQADTEPEAIFKACEWILENKG